MYINTNISALQSANDLQNTQNTLGNLLQQLSSGYQINSAADNPAGLAISQQMQSQIDGLNQAGQNAQSGISLLQTADGALNNIDSILQSMYSLASQAATGTNNPTDLQALQQEMNQYSKEITTITNTTQFNTLNLLSGAFGGTGTPQQSIQIGANSGQELSLGINAMDANSLGVVGFTVASGTNTAALTYSELGSGLQKNATYTVDLAYTAAKVTGATPVSFTMSGASDVTYTVVGAGTSYTVTGSDGYSANVSTLTNFIVNDQTGGFTGTVTMTTTGSFSVDSASVSASLAGSSGQIGQTVTVFGGTGLGGTGLGGTITVGGTAAGGPSAGALVGFTLSSGAVASLTSGTTPTGASSSFTVAETGQAAVTTGNGSVQANAIAGSGLDISSQASAANALTILNSALTKVNQQRATIGAYQNRLQFAVSNAQTSANNLTSAQAGIMDTNVAVAMAKLSQEQILQQSGIAMLAQANAIPQAMLKLFP